MPGLKRQPLTVRQQKLDMRTGLGDQGLAAFDDITQLQGSCLPPDPDQDGLPGDGDYCCDLCHGIPPV